VIVYVARRLAGLAMVLLGMSFVVFVVARALPGDPARAALGDDAPAERVAEYRTELGLDRPILLQYASYLRSLLRGDFGVSIISRRPVVADLAELLPATVELALLSVIVAIVLGVGLGLFSVISPGRVPVALARAIPVLSLSMPTFWLGLVLQLILYGKLGWLPAGGQWDAALPPVPRATGFLLLDTIISGDAMQAWRAVKHLAMPTFVLAQVSLGAFARITRSALLDVLGEPWVRTARAKGLTTARVIVRHALPVAAAPIVTVIGLRLGSVMGGAVLTETIFAWPGIGRYAVFSIENLDFPAIMGFVLFVSFAYAVLNFLVDLCYVWLDPRVRL
jgi:peptide/nickel transport system permease protein